jgi:penicillin amidase
MKPLGFLKTTLAAAVIAASAAAWAVQPSVIKVPGIRAAVHINVDKWGVPHIFGSSEDDVFFAQGFNAARDRLFQIDLWRLRGLGRLSEAFGPTFVEKDRAARLFLYRGDMAREWAAYGPRSNAERVATQFVAGINAYIDWLEENPEAMPPEFRMLGHKPAKWAPEDVVRIRSHALTANLSDEVSLARGLACQGRLDLNPVRIVYEPPHTTRVPEGLDPCSIPANVLSVYNLAVGGVNFTGIPTQPLALTEPQAATLEGSNNWTITPSRTTTGRPILANDPHRAHGAPSLRYIAHLSAPGLNVIGAGEPALPGISIGHNGTIAFGLTIHEVDAQDLYVYELDESLQSYRYGNGWEAIRTVEEQVAVKNAPAQTVQLQFTRHGPVIRIDAAARKAYAVRSIWLEPGTSAYFGSIDYMRARNWEQFVDALSRWGVPGENQVYADAQGNIGWKPGGLAPKRRGYDGLMPVPGDGRYEWDGFYAGTDYAAAFNPPQGYFATANQFTLPSPTGARVGYEWTNPDRWKRLIDVLSRPEKHSLQDSKDLQNDLVSGRVMQLVELLRPLTSEDPLTAEALNLLKNWDLVERVTGQPGAAAARLAETYWLSRVRTAVTQVVLPNAADRAFVSNADWILVHDVLQNPSFWFGANAEAQRNDLLLSTLRAAYVQARADRGTDTSTWTWGSTTNMNHPLGSRDPAFFNVQTPPKGGSGTAPIASQAASFKMVIDVGAWDNSVALNTPGQSGVPTSPHYRDLAPMWWADEYFPLLYSREAVDAYTESRILLVPVPKR